MDTNGTLLAASGTYKVEARRMEPPGIELGDALLFPMVEDVDMNAVESFFQPVYGRAWHRQLGRIARQFPRRVMYGENVIRDTTELRILISSDMDHYNRVMSIISRYIGNSRAMKKAMDQALGNYVQLLTELLAESPFERNMTLSFESFHWSNVKERAGSEDGAVEHLKTQWVKVIVLKYLISMQFNARHDLLRDMNLMHHNVGMFKRNNRFLAVRWMRTPTAREKIESKEEKHVEEGHGLFF